jgi:hypothetical protein
MDNKFSYFRQKKEFSFIKVIPNFCVMNIFFILYFVNNFVIYFIMKLLFILILNLIIKIKLTTIDRRKDNKCDILKEK